MANNKAKAIDEVLNELADEVNDAKAVPFSKELCIVSRDHILDMIDIAIDNLPDDIAQARSLIQTKEKIISDANARAESILNEARETARRLTDNHEILQAAQKRAREITEENEAKVADLKKEAISYVTDKLNTAVLTIETSLNEIKSLKKNITSSSSETTGGQPKSRHIR